MRACFACVCAQNRLSRWQASRAGKNERSTPRRRRAAKTHQRVHRVRHRRRRDALEIRGARARRQRRRAVGAAARERGANDARRVRGRLGLLRVERREPAAEQQRVVAVRRRFVSTDAVGGCEKKEGVNERVVCSRGAKKKKGGMWRDHVCFCALHRHISSIRVAQSAAPLLPPKAPHRLLSRSTPAAAAATAGGSARPRSGVSSGVGKSGSGLTAAVGTPVLREGEGGQSPNEEREIV